MSGVRHSNGACCGAHHLGRVLRAQGHEVRSDVAGPYVKSQKNNDGGHQGGGKHDQRK
jgi:hypothetical protein